ncbi:MAG: ABC transporter substrate-binding protein [Fimbriimonadaceae bacterium]
MNGTRIVFALVVLGVLGAAWWSEQIVRVPERPDRIEITYWEKWTGFEGEGIRAVVDKFNAEQDRIFVKLLVVSQVDQKTMLSTAGGVPPDLAGLWGSNVAQYADDGLLMPLDDLIAQFGIREEDYIPVYWDIGRYRGRMFALPSTPATTALHYNTRFLQEIGRGPNDYPKTIEELTEVGDRLVVRDRLGRIARAGFLPAEPGWWNWSWGYFFGGRLWDGDRTITCDSPENVRAFEWVQSFSKKYGPSELQVFRSGFGNFSSPQNAFMSQKVGMVLQGVWMYNFISQFEPDLPWAAAPFPHPEDRPDLANMSIAEMDILCIPRGARHPKEAFEFIAWLQKQENMEMLCLSHRKNSPLRKVSDEFWAKHPNPYIRLFHELALSPNAITVPKTAVFAEYQRELNNAFELINLDRATPQKALSDVKARMQPKLEQWARRNEMREARP